VVRHESECALEVAPGEAGEKRIREISPITGMTFYITTETSVQIEIYSFTIAPNPGTTSPPTPSAEIFLLASRHQGDCPGLESRRTRHAAKAANEAG